MEFYRQGVAVTACRDSEGRFRAYLRVRSTVLFKVALDVQWLARNWQWCVTWLLLSVLLAAVTR